MRYSVIFKVVGFLFVFVPMVLLFQNFTNDSSRGKSDSHTWQAKAIKFNNGKTKLKKRPDACLESDWAISLELANHNDNSKYDLILINKNDSSEFELSAVEVSYTMDTCKFKARPGQIKLCFSEEDGYMYDLKIVSSNDSDNKILTKEIIKEYGCDKAPQKVLVEL